MKENTSNFALSLDAWTSSNGHAFMAIVIHYISNTGKLGVLLDLEPSAYTNTSHRGMSHRFP